jgi:hypothetical protein
MRRTELESCCVPTVAAERPALGETHPRDDVERDDVERDVNPPPTPLQLAQRPPKPPHGTLTHIAGETFGVNFTCDYRDGPVTEARFCNIDSIVSASDGSVFVSESTGVAVEGILNHRVRKINNGVVSTVHVHSSDVAHLDYCHGVYFDNQGRLLVVSGNYSGDEFDFRIQAVAPNGRTTTVLKLPHDPLYVLPAPDGSIFYSAEGLSIRKISTDGIMTMIAGGDNAQGWVDGPGNNARFTDIQGMAFTASGTLVVCDRRNNRLRRVDPNNGQVTTIDLEIDCPRDISCSLDGTLYVLARDGVYEIGINNDTAFFRAKLAHSSETNGTIICCHLDEPNGHLYIGTDRPTIRSYILRPSRIFTISVSTVRERCATHIFPLARIWALVQAGRADITPSEGVISVREANAHEALSRVMHLRVVGVLALVLRFAFTPMSVMPAAAAGWTATSRSHGCCLNRDLDFLP